MTKCKMIGCKRKGDTEVVDQYGLYFIVCYLHATKDYFTIVNINI